MIPSTEWILGSVSDRDNLVRFWLFSPSDQLELLWNTSLGNYSIELIKSLNPDSSFTAEQISTREAIGSFFNEHGLSHPLSKQLMLANFLLSPPGLVIPRWHRQSRVLPLLPTKPISLFKLLTAIPSCKLKAGEK